MELSSVTDMVPMEGFFWGLLGGTLPEFYALYNIREDFHKKKPRWIKSWFYWIVTLVMVLLGGAVVLLYLTSGTSLTPFLAIHLGAATPTLIGSFIKDKPAIESPGG
ncbi:MAG: hypothetical protein ACK4SG_08730 [Thermomonas sp.]